jgi:hypothetical protein
MSKANAVRLSLVIAAAALAYPALADIEVISSTVPGLSAGTKLPDNAEIDVGKGEVIHVMKAGKTYEIAGPYKGTVDQYTRDCPWWRDMLGKCDKQPPVDEGATPGATRGMVTEPGGTPAGER